MRFDLNRCSAGGLLLASTILAAPAFAAEPPPAPRWSRRPAEPPRSLGEILKSETVSGGRRTVPLGAPSGLATDGDLDIGGRMRQGGISFMHNAGGAAAYNTAIGISALVSMAPPDSGFDSATYNTANGAYALYANDTGNQNTASGAFALVSNKGGMQNTANGAGALLLNTLGERDTAVGAFALFSNTTGSGNSATGTYALYSNQGSGNTATGVYALGSNTIGSDNTAVGYLAGSYSRTGSGNIFIGNRGDAYDSGVVKIGNTFNTTTFIEGIFGVTGSGAQVVVDSNNQLATLTSSRRFKEQIEDMAGASAALDQLRPVTFLYTEEAAGEGTRPLEFGLIAEEVAEVYPELVIYDEQDEPYSVRYHLLTPMLLNEVKKLQNEIVSLRQRDGELAQLRARIELLESAEAGGRSGGL